ncbi:hypothetical protein [Actinoplanes sp. NPDC051411]|uniref:LGFP repeat-containing protein n=1 Tax=Actinoplanes sp. NPDC051411 TaxID=3155522 RepID=UPI0034426235
MRRIRTVISHLRDRLRRFAAKPPAVPSIEKPPSRTSFAEIAGIWGVLFATPTSIIGILDLPAGQKAIWFTTFFVEAVVLTLLLGWLFRWTKGTPERRRHSVAILLVATTAVLLLGGVAGRSWQTAVRERAAPACVPVGAGNEEYEKVFFDAYERGGGASALGCPLGPVIALLGGHHQNLDGPHGSSAIFATQPDRAYLLTGRPYAAFLAIGAGDGVQSTLQAGFPDSDLVRLRGGGKIGLSDENGQHSALVGRDGRPWYWIPPQIWSRYLLLGGPAGTLGFPTSASTAWNNGIRQIFEHGWLWYRFDRGTLTQKEYADGVTVPGPTAPAASQRLIYQVDCAHGVPHEIPAQGSVRQEFRPTTPFVREIGVVAGLNPRQTTTNRHMVELDLLNRTETVLFRSRVDLVDNGLTNISFPAVRVVPGDPYSIRVTNLSSDIIGVLLANPATSGKPAGSHLHAWLEGEVPRDEGHYDADGALCGRVLGSSG